MSDYLLTDQDRPRGYSAREYSGARGYSAREYSGARGYAGVRARCACFVYGLAFRIARRLAISSPELVDKNLREGISCQPVRRVSSCPPSEVHGRLESAES
jgi:hypothetical protein